MGDHLVQLLWIRNEPKYWLCTISCHSTLLYMLCDIGCLKWVVLAQSCLLFWCIRNRTGIPVLFSPRWGYNNNVLTNLSSFQLVAFNRLNVVSFVSFGLDLKLWQNQWNLFLFVDVHILDVADHQNVATLSIFELWKDSNTLNLSPMHTERDVLRCAPNLEC